MFKHLHSRYAAVVIFLVTLCFIISGTAFFLASTASSYNEKKRVMDETIDYSTQIVPTLFDNDASEDDVELCHEALLLMCSLSDSEITVADSAGKVIFTTIELISPETVLSEEIVSRALEGSAKYSLSTFDGVLPYQQITRTTPIISKDGAQIGAIFLTSETRHLTDFINFFRLFIFSAAGTLIAAIALIFYATKRQLRPLKNMVAVTKKYAVGDFDSRVEITGIEEIDELGFAFNNMAESLSRLEDMRRDFVQNVSHDLRTPMTSISGFVDGILDGTIPPEQYNYYLGLVSDEAKRLTRLTSSLLEVSEIESGKISDRKSEFDICEISAQVVLGFEAKFLEKNLKLKLDIPGEPIICIGNADSLHRVVYNLVENAIKYSFDEGLISVLVAESNNAAVVTVRNTGMGIKADDLPFIFDRFYKVDKSRGLDTSSMGLGLYITKTIVEKNGGNIIARSQYGEFCEFSFTVPLK